jgi:hypothetical protein
MVELLGQSERVMGSKKRIQMNLDVLRTCARGFAGPEGPEGLEGPARASSELAVDETAEMGLVEVLEWNKKG